MSIDRDVVGGVAVVVFVGIGIGVAATIIYKKVKDLKQVDPNEKVITVADLDDILRERRITERKAMEETEDDDHEYPADYKPMGNPVDDIYPSDDETEDYDDTIVLSDEEGGEGKLLKGTDPNSEFALEQFIKMEIAEFRRNSAEEMMIRRLFKYRFLPKTRGDRITHDTLQKERMDFFGPDSKWCWEPTWADLILHFAKRIDYNLGDGVPHWTSYIFDHLNFRPGMKDQELLDSLENLVGHTFINDDTGFVGLFGLDDGGCNDVNDQLKHSVDNVYSFEMELQAFLHMAME